MRWAGVFNVRATVLAAVLGWGALASGPLLAGEQDFTLYNETGVNIYELYVSPASTDQWEEDVLGVDVLEATASTSASIATRMRTTGI